MASPSGQPVSNCMTARYTIGSFCAVLSSMDAHGAAQRQTLDDLNYFMEEVAGGGIGESLLARRARVGVERRGGGDGRRPRVRFAAGTAPQHFGARTSRARRANAARRRERRRATTTRRRCERRRAKYRFGSRQTKRRSHHHRSRIRESLTTNTRCDLRARSARPSSRHAARSTLVPPPRRPQSELPGTLRARLRRYTHMCKSLRRTEQQKLLLGQMTPTLSHEVLKSRAAAATVAASAQRGGEHPIVRRARTSSLSARARRRKRSRIEPSPPTAREAQSNRRPPGAGRRRGSERGAAEASGKWGPTPRPPSKHEQQQPYPSPTPLPLSCLALVVAVPRARRWPWWRRRP